MELLNNSNREFCSQLVVVIVLINSPIIESCAPLAQEPVLGPPFTIIALGTAITTCLLYKASDGKLDLFSSQVRSGSTRLGMRKMLTWSLEIRNFC